MATLLWNEGEGYDIHVLRGGPRSKPLDKALELDPAGTLTFVPHFKGAPNNLGVSVNTTTGEVTASIQQGAASFNFLMTARQDVAGVISETIIRIHIHETVKRIWLTPEKLPVYLGEAESRFTVLAMFDRDPDGVVGDITDWSVLKYSSFNKFEIDVNNKGDIFRGEEEPLGGRLIGRVPGEVGAPMEKIDITVELDLTTPPTDLEHTAKAIWKPDWEALGRDEKKTEVEFVAGESAPRPNQPDRTKKDSIEWVIDNHANILFISDGFLSSQKDDFRKKVVQTIVTQELLKNQFLEPFKLLKDSINYWSLFLPSDEEGTTLLGDYEISGAPGKQTAAELPQPEAPTGTQWTIANMIHEAGLPLPSDPQIATSSDWVTNRSKLFKIPTGVTVDAAALRAWNDLRKRSLINERGSAFGLRQADRPQASGQRAREELLVLDPRRTSPESVQKFVSKLRFINKAPMGQVWEHGTGKDFGLICFVCQSSRMGGSFHDAPIMDRTSGTIRTRFAYFAAGTGMTLGAGVKPNAGGNGMDLVPRPIDKGFSPEIYASVVAHECGHALGLADEYGGPATYDPKLHGTPLDPNLQVQTLLAPNNPSTNKRKFKSTEIKWNWPRVQKARFLDGEPNLVGDPPQFAIPLLPGGGKNFAKDDLARIREWPVRKQASMDPFATIVLQVDSATATSATVSYVDPSQPHLDPNNFSSSKRYVLVCTGVKSRPELTLVARVLAKHIDTSNGPLNAPKDSQGAGCVVGNSKGPMTASNLPRTFRPPAKLPAKADLIGVYEGGGYLDCGMFRPAGRCKMRTGTDSTVPFCHVCKYLIVDLINPAVHGKLDDEYAQQYP